jgi:hypothetical protein
MRFLAGLPGTAPCFGSDKEIACGKTTFLTENCNPVTLKTESSFLIFSGPVRPAFGGAGRAIRCNSPRNAEGDFRCCPSGENAPMIPFHAFDPELFDFHQIRFSFGEITEEASRN